MLFYASGKTDYDRFLKIGKELRSVNWNTVETHVCLAAVLIVRLFIIRWLSANTVLTQAKKMPNCVRVH